MSYIPEPVTRIDKYLAYIAGNMDVALPDHPITRKEHYLAAWAEKSGFEDVDVTGKPPLTLENAIGKPLKGLKLYGKSKQATTTGAQLIDINSFQKNNNFSVKIVNNYSIELTSTIKKDASDSNNVYLNVIINADILVGKTITMSCDGWNSNVPNETAVCGIMYNINGETHYETILRGSMIQTLTIPLGAKDCKVRLFLIEIAAATVKAGTYTAIIKGLMICEGTVAKSWEPYTGGIPSPNPDYPQEIKSVVNPTVKVTNEDGLKVQSVTLNNITLNAIPVSSGGNVTINGQKYIADYVDVGRGKLVKNLKSFTISNREAVSTWGVNKNADNITGFYFYLSQNGLPENKNNVVISTILQYENNAWGGKKVGCSMSSDSYNNYAIFSVPTNILEDISSDENACASFVKICENTNAIFFYSMVTPIETPLTSDQLAAYKALHTYKGTTIIDNDAGAYMSVRYEKMK